MSRTILDPRRIAALSALALSVGGCPTDAINEAANWRDGSTDESDAGPDELDASQPGMDGSAPNMDLDGGAPDSGELDGSAPDSSAPGDTDAGQDAGPPDDIAPFALDCNNLPSNGVCQGGPHEVLLVTTDEGLIAMFEPTDGHFLGYFKRPGIEHYVNYDDGYWFATQGPDQCIWTVSEDVPASSDKVQAGVQRWNTDGTFRDAPLKAHSLPIQGGAPQPAIDSPLGLSFSADKLYVASSDRITRWKLNGEFDSVVFESDSIAAILALGDGSLLYSEQSGGNGNHRLMRLAAGGASSSVVFGKLDWPGQISYAGDGQVLVESSNLGSTAYRVNVETGQALTVYPVDGGDNNIYGIAPLSNGKWLIASGNYYVTVLDPALDPSTHVPTGENVQVWDDSAVDTNNFKQIGRACLSEAFLASRASKPANDTCIPPPAGANIFWEDFEGTGDFTGTGKSRQYKGFHDHGAAGFTPSIATGPGTNTSRALKIAGAGNITVGGQTYMNKAGVYATFNAAKPVYISYQVYVEAVADQSLGFFLLENAAADTYKYDQLAGTYFYNGYFNTMTSDAGSYPDTLESQWVKVEMRNIDWTARTYDLYVNCKRMAEAIGLPAGLGDTADLIDLYNFAAAPDSDTVAWFDDILIK